MQAKGGGHGRRSGSEGAGVRSPGGQQPDRGSKPHATNEEEDEEVGGLASICVLSQMSWPRSMLSLSVVY